MAACGKCPPGSRSVFRVNVSQSIYIYRAHTLWHSLHRLVHKAYIYIGRIPFGIAFFDNLCECCRGIPFGIARHTLASKKEAGRSPRLSSSSFPCSCPGRPVPPRLVSSCPAFRLAGGFRAGEREAPSRPASCAVVGTYPAHTQTEPKEAGGPGAAGQAGGM